MDVLAPTIESSVSLAVLIISWIGSGWTDLTITDPAGLPGIVRNTGTSSEFARLRQLGGSKNLLIYCVSRRRNNCTWTAFWKYPASRGAMTVYASVRST